MTTKIKRTQSYYDNDRKYNHKKKQRTSYHSYSLKNGHSYYDDDNKQQQRTVTPITRYTYHDHFKYHKEEYELLPYEIRHSCDSELRKMCNDTDIIVRRIREKAYNERIEYVDQTVNAFNLVYNEISIVKQNCLEGEGRRYVKIRFKSDKEYSTIEEWNIDNCPVYHVFRYFIIRLEEKMLKPYVVYNKNMSKYHNSKIIIDSVDFVCNFK